MITKNNLNELRWKAIKLDTCFNIDKGIYLHGDNITIGNIPYITARAENNGLNSFIGNKSLFKENTLTIEKVKLSAFYQPYQFYCSHDVSVVISDKLNKYNGLFVCCQINRQGFKYSYGRQAQMNVVKKEKILLPVNSKKEPDYEFMESYIKDLQTQKEKEYLDYISKRIEHLKDIQKPVALEEKEWSSVFLSDLLLFEKGDQNNMSSLKAGDMPLVSAKKNDNAYKGFVVYNGKKTYFKNTLTLNNDGDGGAGLAFYQPNNYLLDSHVTALYPKNALNRFVLLFLSMCITLQRNKFGHGYAINNKRLKVFQIMLPINNQGQPDYEYMEHYMKYLEYQKLKAYLDFKAQQSN